MNTFHDNGPRQFVTTSARRVDLKVTVLSAKRVRDATGENLFELVTSGIERLAGDPVLIAEVVFAVADLGDQVTFEEFAGELGGQATVIDALDAFLRACADFYRGGPVEEAIGLLIEKLAESREAAIAQARAEIEKARNAPTTPYQGETAPTPSCESCTGSPEPQESSPTGSPSESCCGSPRVGESTTASSPELSPV